MRSALNQILASAKEPSPELELEDGDIPEAATFGELLEDGYDYGEPAWNGVLLLTAKALVVAEPRALVVESLEEPTAVDAEFIDFFHHGDVTVTGDGT